MVIDLLADCLDVVDVFQAGREVGGGGGTDEDVAAVEYLLDDSSLVADTADFFQPEGMVVFAEDATGCGDFLLCDMVGLASTEVCRSMTDFTTSPEVILSYRQKIGDMIEKLPAKNGR